MSNAIKDLSAAFKSLEKTIENQNSTSISQTPPIPKKTNTQLKFLNEEDTYVPKIDNQKTKGVPLRAEAWEYFDCLIRPTVTLGTRAPRHYQQMAEHLFTLNLIFGARKGKMLAQVLYEQTEHPYHYHLVIKDIFSSKNINNVECLITFNGRGLSYRSKDKTTDTLQIRIASTNGYGRENGYVKFEKINFAKNPPTQTNWTWAWDVESNDPCEHHYLLHQDNKEFNYPLQFQPSNRFKDLDSFYQAALHDLKMENDPRSEEKATKIKDSVKEVFEVLTEQDILCLIEPFHPSRSTVSYTPKDRVDLAMQELIKKSKELEWMKDFSEL